MSHMLAMNHSINENKISLNFNMNIVERNIGGALILKWSWEAELETATIHLTVDEL